MGLIEICLNSAWKELCDDSRDGFHTTFMCRQLGNSSIGKS